MPLELISLAAGLGSRFGGDKQIEEFGPGGETLLELNAYDAIQAGADSLSWVTRADLVPALELRARHLRAMAPVRIETQSPSLDPRDSTSPRRTRPWGTAHAWMAGQGSGNSSLVLNADDLYGAAAIRSVVDAMRSAAPATTNRPTAWLAGYRVADTLSPHGGVSRAWIRTGPADAGAGHAKVIGLDELQDVRRDSSENIRGTDSSGAEVSLTDDTLVSMNLWGFVDGWMPLLGESLKRFREEHGGDPSAEFRIPDVVFEGVSAGLADAFVVPVTSRWAGVTFPEDRSHLEKTLLEEFRSGTYPSPLFPPQTDSAHTCN